jgi:hypothetical protein
VSVFAAGTAADLIRVVWTSLVASVAVSVLFSGAVVGLIRASELRRDSGRDGRATVLTASAIVALMLCLAAVVYGVILVSQKS